MVVLTKSDLPRGTDGDGTSPSIAGLKTSSVDLTGLEELREEIRQRLVANEGSDLMVASTATRCRDSLRLTVQSLERALALTETSAGEELVAAELRIALDELGKVVGVTYTDDILDRIFSRFCIGK